MRDFEAAALALLNSDAQSWWKKVREQNADYFKAGEMLALPRSGTLNGKFEQLYVRKVFDRLFTELYTELRKVTFRLFHINGNSGVGKSAFLWYFIIRMGVEHPDDALVYQTPAYLWVFDGKDVEVKRLADDKGAALSEDISFHLIDQRVDVGRCIGIRAIVAASPDANNLKEAKKLRTVKTRYLPPWDKPEYDDLVQCWKKWAEALPPTCPDRKIAEKRLGAANLAYEWFGGIPRFIWAWDEDLLTEEDFKAEISVCLANTKLENVRAVLQDKAAAQNAWRLFHFQTKPNDLRTCQYTFCSEKVATLYAQYLALENFEQLRAFIEASEPLPEYAALRGFVFEQFAIGQALQKRIVGMPMVDVIYCRTCRMKNDRPKSPKVKWIECSNCRQWFCVKQSIRVKVVRDFRCIHCPGPQQQEDVSAAVSPSPRQVSRFRLPAVPTIWEGLPASCGRCCAV